MAQTKLHQHKDEIKSWEANVRALGPVSPGRIRGYDKFTEGASDASNVKLNIGHQTNLPHDPQGTSAYSGLEYTDTGGSTETDLGVAIMKNGTMIIEDGTLGPFDIPINQAAGERQRVWIVASHTWTAVTGGSSATYSVIAGAVSTGSTYNDPVLTTPEDQVVIAEFDIPKTSEYARTFANIIAISKGAIQQYSNGRTDDQMRAELDLYTATYIDANFYTQTYIDANLYTQTEVDALLAAQLTDIEDTPETWLNPTLNANVVEEPSSGWSGSEEVRYRRTLDNKVELKGTFTADASSTSNNPVFTLPVGYRPASTKVLSFAQDNTTGSYYEGLGTVRIETNGQVNITQDSANIQYCSFDGLIFSLD